MAYYKGKGSLFINEEREGKEPHFRGFIEVTREQVQALQELLDRGVEEPKVQIGAFKMIAKKSKRKYLFLGTEIYIKDDDAPPKPRRTEPEEDEWDDDIPFG